MNHIKTLFIYFQQRFSLLLWGTITAYMILFTHRFNDMDAKTLVNAVQVLFTFFMFRLWDDLYQVPYDQGKPNRIYLERNAHRQLTLAFSVLLAITACWIGLQDMEHLLGLSVVVLTFWILYRFFISNAIAAQILPLLKYPLIAFMLIYHQHVPDYTWVYSLAICSTVGSLVFLGESLTTPDFILNKNSCHIYLKASALITLVIAHFPKGWIAGIVLMAVVLLANKTELKFKLYSFLAIALVMQLLLLNHVI